MLTRSLFLIAALLPAVAHAGLTAIIQTDTSSLAGQTGYVDFQFNAFSGASAATVTVFDFSTSGLLGACPSAGCFSGDATGGIGSGQNLVIQNGATDNSGLNDFTLGITFGTNVTFLVTFSGAAFDTPGAGGGTFALSYFAPDNQTPLLSIGDLGASLTVTVDKFGALIPMGYEDANGNIDSSFMETPEPASFLSVLGALVGLGLYGATLKRGRSLAVCSHLVNY